MTRVNDLFVRTSAGDSHRRFLVQALFTAMFCHLALLSSASATPTGLNNIPTADTPPDRTVVFQSFATWGGGQPDSYWVGMKMGLTPAGQKLEWGVDGRLGGEDQFGVFQVKYAVQPWEQLPAIAFGVSNITTSGDQRNEAGHPNPYLVATQDLSWFRVTVGYGLQHDNEAAFFGFDKTVRLFDRDLMWRFDMTQIDDGDQWLGSAGLIYFLDKHLAVESWVSSPFEDGEVTFTLKFNVIVEF